MMDSESLNEDEMLEELKAILAIPEFKAILNHKIKEWKVVIGSNIEDIRKFIETENYHERKESSGDDLRGEIDFELHRLRGLWFPRLPKKTEVFPFDALPMALIRYITEKSNEVFLKKPVQIPGFSPVLLSFSKEKNDLISGTIQRIKTDGKKVENLETISPDHLPTPGRNKPDKLRLFLEYLLTNDDFYNDILDQFFYKWKPIIDQKLIEMSR